MEHTIPSWDYIRINQMDLSTEASHLKSAILNPNLH